jgi:hypothetical protein
MALTLSGTDGVTGPNEATTVKAWVNFNGTGTVAIRADGNVASITDNGTGDYTINISSGLTDADYSHTSMTQWVSGVSFNLCHVESGYTPTSSAIEIVTMNNSGTKTDAARVGVNLTR